MTSSGDPADSSLPDQAAAAEEEVQFKVVPELETSIDASFPVPSPEDELVDEYIELEDGEPEVGGSKDEDKDPVPFVLLGVAGAAILLGCFLWHIGNF
jgi:hypothetical protein